MLRFGHSVDANGRYMGTEGGGGGGEDEEVVVCPSDDTFVPYFASYSCNARLYSADRAVFAIVALAFAKAIREAYLLLRPKIAYRKPTRMTSNNIRAYSNANRISTDGPDARKNVPNNVNNNPSLANNTQRNEISLP